METLKQAVFPVAGAGQRLYPASRAVSKELLPLRGQPLIDYAFAEALVSGVERFIFITGENGAALAHYLNWDDAALAILEKQGMRKALSLARMQKHVEKIFIRQEKPLGLGDAVLCAQPALADVPFAVLLPDDVIQATPPCLVQMARAYCGGHMVAVESVAPEAVSRYGIIAPQAGERGQLQQLAGLVEKPAADKAPSTLAIIGRYILSPSIFPALAAGKAGVGSEIQLTDALAARLESDTLWGWQFTGTRHDCGTQAGLSESWQNPIRLPDLGEIE